MNKVFFIADSPRESNSKNSLNIYWQKGLKKKNDIDILEYIEKKPKKYRNIYLNFIENLNEKKIDIGREKFKINHYMTVDGFESFKYTSVYEKCNWSKSFYINELLKCYAIKELIIKYKPSFININLKNYSPTLKILESILKKYKIDNNLSLKKNSFIFSNKFFFLKILKCLISYSLFILKNYKIKNHRSKTWINFNSDKLFISYLNNEDVENIKKNSEISSYWGNLSNSIKKNKKISWIYFCTSTGKYFEQFNISKTVFKKNKKFKNQIHINFYDFLNIKNILKSISIWFIFLYRLRKIKNLNNFFIDESQKVNNAYYLKKDFILSFYSFDMIQNILIFLTFREILQKISKKKKCFYLFERAPWEISLIKNLRKFDHGKIYAVGHSTISTWDLRYSKNMKTNSKKASINEPDYFIVNGSDMMSKVQDMGYNKKRIINAEALRYQYLYKIKKNKVKIKNKKLKALLILDIDKEIAFKQLKLAEKLVDDFDKIILKIKMHPTYDIKKFSSNKIRQNFSLKTLKELFSDCHIIISSNITSANSEAVFLNIPVFCFNDPNNINLSPILDNKLINFFSDYMDLKNLLEKKIYLKKIKDKKKEIFNLDKKNRNWISII